MSLRSALLLGAAIIGLAVTGCARAVADHTTWSIPTVGPNVEHLAVQLGHDRWVPNRDWTPRTEREGTIEGKPRAGRLRWAYYEPPFASAQKAKSDIDPARRAAPPLATTHPLTEADILPDD